jgi:hypothetical protein
MPRVPRCRKGCASWRGRPQACAPPRRGACIVAATLLCIAPDVCTLVPMRSAREGRAAMQRASDAVAAAAAAAAMPPRRGRAAWLHVMPREWTREWDAADAAALEDAAPAAKEAAVGLHAATSKVPPPPLPRLVRRAAAAAAP